MKERGERRRVRKERGDRGAWLDTLVQTELCLRRATAPSSCRSCKMRKAVIMVEFKTDFPFPLPLLPPASDGPFNQISINT